MFLLKFAVGALPTGGGQKTPDNKKTSKVNMEPNTTMPLVTMQATVISAKLQYLLYSF